MIFYIKWEFKVQIDWYDLEVLMNHMKYKLKTKKNFHTTTKKTTNWVKNNPIEWERTLPTSKSERRLIKSIIKKSKSKESKNQMTQFKDWLCV